MDNPFRADGPPTPEDEVSTETSATNRERPRENAAGRGGSSEDSIKSGPQNLFPVPTQWTNEKHNLYLSSMESSFLNQLCNELNGSNVLLGSLPLLTPKAPKDTGSNSNCIFSCQLKILRKGSWKTLDCSRKRSRFTINNDTRLLFENPWIQHFTSRNRPFNPVDSNELINRARHSGRSTGPNQEQPNRPRMRHQVPPGSNAEVSDQNFVDSDSGEENQTRAVRRKRAKVENIKSPVKDKSILDALTVPLKMFSGLLH